MEENPNAGVREEESDNEIEYDEDGNPLAPKKSKVSVHLRLNENEERFSFFVSIFSILDH